MSGSGPDATLDTQPSIHDPSWCGVVLLHMDRSPVLGTASIATLSNIGPGLGLVGPTGDFAFFSSWQKIVMIFLMWLGRLEFFAVLALLHPRFWTR